jgi:O-antigen/teichoic acid export membrane protein
MATSSHFSDRRAHERLRARSLRVSAIGAGIVVLLTPVSWALAPVLFGQAYESGRGPLAILMLATAVITLAAPLHPFAISMGRDRAYALILVGGAAGNIAANLALIPWLGMIGAALTTLGAQVVVSGLLWWLVRRHGVDAVTVLPDQAHSAPSDLAPERPS